MTTLFPDSCAAWRPFSGERLITEAQPTSLAFARNALLSAALNSIGWMPAAACLSRSDLDQRVVLGIERLEPELRVVSTFFCASLRLFQVSRLTSTPTSTL
jgi:hypothetical protein